MYTLTVKGEQFLDTQYRGKPPSATAKTKHCQSLSPLGNIFLSKKTHENYFLLQVYNYTTYTPEGKIRTRHKKERGREK